MPHYSQIRWDVLKTQNLSSLADGAHVVLLSLPPELTDKFDETGQPIDVPLPQGLPPPSTTGRPPMPPFPRMCTITCRFTDNAHI